MSEEQKPSNEQSQPQQLRQNLVNTAVNFLLNPSVIDKAYGHKAAFLRKKGLTDAEISSAFEIAESDPKYKEILGRVTLNNSAISPPLPPPIPAYGKSTSFWSQLSRTSSSLIILGVAIFGAHYFYKKFIEPLIFGKESESNKSLKLEKQLLEMTNSISQLEKNVSTLEESIKYHKMQMDRFFQNEVNEYCPTPLALRELKAEIGSVKSLLLNRHQFPALPRVSPTIPPWQLATKEDTGDTVKLNSEDVGQQHSTVTKSLPNKEQLQHTAENDHDTVKQNGEQNESNSSCQFTYTQSELSENINGADLPLS